MIARAEPHCWWCGTTADDGELPHWKVFGGVEVRVCEYCYRVLKKGTMKARLGQCPPDCSGCKRKVEKEDFL
jgi:hypothetical protein